MQASFVYFLQVAGGGPIKIGFAADPQNRLASLTSWCPYPLEMIADAPGCRISEAAIHEMFAKDRLHGEWFHPSDALLEFVASVKEKGALPDHIPSTTEPANAGIDPSFSALREVLKRNGLSMKFVAAELGIPANTMPNYADRLPAHRAVQIAAFLTKRGITTAPSDLYGKNRRVAKPRRQKSPA